MCVCVCVCMHACAHLHVFTGQLADAFVQSDKQLAGREAVGLGVYTVYIYIYVCVCVCVLEHMFSSFQHRVIVNLLQLFFLKDDKDTNNLHIIRTKLHYLSPFYTTLSQLLFMRRFSHHI